MKKVLFLISTLCVFACSEDADIVMNDSITYENHVISENHKIDEAKALEYANIYFNQTETRSSAPLKMDYIVDEMLTRSGEMADDTVAYIINRGMDDGFVIISSDDRVYPILAHSDKGTFVHEEGSVVDLEFVSRIGSYIAQNERGDAKELTASELDGCYSGTPVLGTSWGQRSPFDKYVILEHPQSPVGCVPIAIGQIMANCKPTHTYHNVLFDFERILPGISAGPTRGIVNGDDNIIVSPPYSYDEAIDYVAQLVYWIGKDLDADYGETTGANSMYAYYLMVLEGYNVNNSGLTAYNVHDVISYLLNGNLVYMRGNNIVTNAGGHAWVADAARYCVNYATNDTTIAEIHCDWGWYGDCNGFYSGEVFAAKSDYQYANMEYFAVEIE